MLRLINCLLHRTDILARFDISPPGCRVQTACFTHFPTLLPNTLVADSPLKPPIILLGNVRSGTTMIHDLFDTHQQVVSWFEPRTLWLYADPRRKHDQFDASDATDRVKNYIRKRFLQFQQTHGNRRVMEKTPSNLMRIPYVHAIFPESKLLYILREPLANLSSVDLRGRKAITRKRAMERIAETPKSQLHYYLTRYVIDHFRVRVLGKRPTYYGVRYPGFNEDRAHNTRFQMIARQWVACAQAADRELAKIDPALVHRIRYEDFVANPVQEFDRILAHFELSMTPELKTKLSSWVDAGRQQKWKRLDPTVLAECLPILRDEMIKQGYEIPAEVAELAATSA